MTATRRLLPLALLALSPLPAFAGDAPPAAAARIDLMSERVAVEPPGSPPKNPDPATPRANQPSQPLELDAAVPAGVTALPASKGKTLYGTLKVGESTSQFAVVLGEDGGATVFADANKDGKFDADKESAAVKGEEWKMGARILGRSWTAPKLSLGSGTVAVTVRERTPEMLAQVVEPGPRGQNGFAVLSTTAPAAVKKPATLPGTAYFAVMTVGGMELAVQVARGEGDALAMVVDAKGTGDLTEGTTLKMTPAPQTRGKKRTGTRWSSEPTTIAREGKPAKPFVFQASEALADLSATVGATETRRAFAAVDGKDYALFLLDGDLDGAYTGPEDFWWFGPRASVNMPRPDNMFPSNEPCWVKGGAWKLLSVAPDGAVAVAPAADAGSPEEFLRKRSERVNERRWFSRFAEDPAWAKQHDVDESRPRAEKPIAFHFALSMADARAFAEKEGKPLLIDFEADWCVWCKRLDYHTYPDREVAETMAKFTAVKINNEIDPEQTFRNLKGLDGKGWGGIPSLAIYGPDGLLLPFHAAAPDGTPTGPVVDHIGGWLNPKAFVATLKSALAAYQDVKDGKPKLELPHRAMPAGGHPGMPGAPPGPAAPPPPAPPGMGPDAPPAPKPGEPAAPAAPK